MTSCHFDQISKYNISFDALPLHKCPICYPWISLNSKHLKSRFKVHDGACTSVRCYYDVIQLHSMSITMT